eukprot:7398509-Alexandrium_andersonii.AAC.1
MGGPAPGTAPRGSPKPRGGSRATARAGRAGEAPLPPSNSQSRVPLTPSSSLSSSVPTPPAACGYDTADGG